MSYGFVADFEVDAAVVFSSAKKLNFADAFANRNLTFKCKHFLHSSIALGLLPPAISFSSFPRCALSAGSGLHLSRRRYSVSSFEVFSIH